MTINKQINTWEGVTKVLQMQMAIRQCSRASIVWKRSVSMSVNKWPNCFVQ